MNSELFVPTFGNRPLRIVGRERIIEDFRGGIESSPGHPNRASVLIGQRGMGKTALLLEFAEIGETAGFVAVRVAATGSMLDDIIESIQVSGSRFVQGKKSVKAVSAGALGFSFGLTFTDETEKHYGFRTKLTLLVDELAKYGIGLLILIDEIQASSPAMRELATTYQHLVGDGKNIAIVMAGLPHALSSVLNDDVLTFLNRANRIRLMPIALSEVRSFYAECFLSIGVRIPSDALEAAVSATFGYPYLMQLVGYYLLKYLGNAKAITGDITRMAVASAGEALVDSIHKPCLKPLSDKDITFLKAMAEDTTDSTVADMQKRLNVSNGTVQTYKQRLMDAGIIASERRGRIEFVIPYLREYLSGIMLE